MTTLMQASHQWATRPDDQRFTSLFDMKRQMDFVRDHSNARVVSSRSIELVPVGTDHRGLVALTGDGKEYAPTHFSFGQLAQLAEGPAAYLRTLPSEIAADALNYGLGFKRGVSDVGVLVYDNGTTELRAATGPNYGRIWNSDIVSSLIDHAGDGVSGDWRVPGEWGNSVEVTKSNTTLYASDRDMFVFLADERHRIAMPNRRNGSSGSLARGFFVWNSEVGDKTFGIATFLFDYVCGNRIVWGAEGFKEIRIRHTASAPDKWLEEVKPALLAYANSTESTVLDTVAAAQAKKIDDLDDFLSKRFSLSRNRVAAIKVAHEADEGRPMETLWDATTGITAYARGIQHQDERVQLERIGGAILDLATA
jgi:hypothetical protein